VLLLALSGCSGGLFSTGAPRSFPPLEAGKGRVYIYRTSSYTGAAYTPDVLLNGVRVGKPGRRGVVYRDVAPGSYAVTTTITSSVVNFAVAAGERKYVRINAGLLKTQLLPVLVDQAEGEAEVSRLPPM
jgi:hypothetical protein